MRNYLTSALFLVQEYRELIKSCGATSPDVEIIQTIGQQSNFKNHNFQMVKKNWISIEFFFFSFISSECSCLWILDFLKMYFTWMDLILLLGQSNKTFSAGKPLQSKVDGQRGTTSNYTANCDGWFDLTDCIIKHSM